jgi:hypothetical protein
MELSPEESDFRQWLRDIRSAIDVDFGALLQDDESLEWYREIYGKHGSISAGSLSALIEEARREALNAALREVLHEVKEKRGEELAFSIEERSDNPLGCRPGFYLLGTQLYSVTEPDGIAEIGEIIQDEIIDRDQEVWPVCPDHTVGLHAKVVDGRAVWWCNPGSHSLGEIGASNSAAGQGHTELLIDDLPPSQVS